MSWGGGGRGAGSGKAARFRIPTAADGHLRQVRREYRRYFRTGASARLANFIYRRLVSGAGGKRGHRTFPAPHPWGWTGDTPDPLLCCHPPLPSPPQVQKFLVGLARNLPPLSVMDRTWPPAPYKFLADANQELRSIFYRWKVGAGWGGDRGAGKALAWDPASLHTSPPRHCIIPSLGSARSTGSS